MLKRTLIIGIILIGMMSLVGCVSTESENRDYRPKGDAQMKEDMSSEELMSYNMGMDDTKTFLKANNNQMTSVDVYENLVSKVNDDTIQIRIDSTAYFKGVAYYLILVDDEGNEYMDLECAKYLEDNYKPYLKSKIKENINSKEEVKKEESEQQKPQTVISNNEIEDEFRHVIAKAYLDISDEVELLIYDNISNGIVEADAVYMDQLLAKMYLNLYTGELTMDRYDQ